MQGKVLPERCAEGPVYVGLDCCKTRLDISIHPTGRTLSVPNSRDGLRRLRRALASDEVALAVVEATGKFHRLAQRTLHGWGIAVAVVNPLRPRLFAEAAGILAKTDPLDARVLAIFGESLKPSARPPAPELVEELQELVRTRQAAKDTAAAPPSRPLPSARSHGSSRVCETISRASMLRSSAALPGTPGSRGDTQS